MLIKKSKSNFDLKYNFKKNIFLLIIIFIFNALFFTYFGVKLSTAGSSHLVKKFLTYHNEYRFDVIKNIVKKPFIKIDKVYLDINFENLKKINKNRNKAIKNKVIIPEYNQNVNAVVKYQDQSIPVRIKLKGGITKNHIENEDQISFKVKTKKSNIFGLTEFSLMHAQRRNFLLEWYARKMYADQGLIYKEYRFINLYINGENKGLYVVDENFTESLSVKNKRREGIYVRFGSDINFNINGIFNEKEDKADLFSTSDGCCGGNENLLSTNIDVLNQQINSNSKNNSIKNFHIARKLLEDFREEKKRPEEIFKLDLMAKAFALSEILGSWHTMHWGNMRFYFDPITSKLEPVIDDNYNEKTTYPAEDRRIRIDDTYNYSLLYKRLFESKVFLEKYIYYQNKYSNPSFIKNFNNKIKKEFTTNLSFINKFYVSYFFPFHVIEANRDRVERFLNPYQPLHFSLLVKNEKKIIIKVGNTSNLPIEIKKIEIIEEGDKSNLINLKRNNDLISKLYLKPRFFNKVINYDYLKFDLFSDKQIKQISLEYKISGLDETISKTLYYPLLTKRSDEINFNNIKDTTSNFKSLDFFQNKILIKKGNFNIDQDLIIPKNKELIIAAGSNINLLKGSKIISHSRIIAEGTPDDPIKISSPDNLGQCILVTNTKKKSILKYVYFKNMSNCSSSSVELTGSINFYKTDVFMKNIYFSDNIKGDDYLNIISSELFLNNLFFSNSHADALDIDYSTGKIQDINFNNSGNDAIDLSNSSIEIKNFKAKKVGDKAISVGENTYLRGESFIINNSFLGLAIKDQSEVDINDLTITNSNIPLATYIKKKEYNSSKINISKFSENNNSTDSIFEKGSNVVINGKIIENLEKNVLKIIYPINN